MKRISLLLLFAFLATASFAQFVGANSVGSRTREGSSLFTKSHSDSFISGFLLKTDDGIGYGDGLFSYNYGLDFGYRFNSYLYAGIGAHVDYDGLYFPIELRAYLPLTNISFFMGCLYGPSIEYGFEYPWVGGRIGVNRRFWALSVSVYASPYQYTDYVYSGYGGYYHSYNYTESRTWVTLNLEYSLPLRAFRK